MVGGGRKWKDPPSAVPPTTSYHIRPYHTTSDQVVGDGTRWAEMVGEGRWWHDHLLPPPTISYHLLPAGA